MHAGIEVLFLCLTIDKSRSILIYSYSIYMQLFTVECMTISAPNVWLIIVAINGYVMTMNLIYRCTVSCSCTMNSMARSAHCFSIELHICEQEAEGP